MRSKTHFMIDSACGGEELISRVLGGISGAMESSTNRTGNANSFRPEVFRDMPSGANIHARTEQSGCVSKQILSAGTDSRRKVNRV